MSESAHQKAVIKWFDIAYPRFSSLLWHTPNGGSRNKLEAFNLKLMGVRAGIPDLFLAVPRGTFHGLFIEMKSEKGKLTALQEKQMALLWSMGYEVKCCHGWLMARDAIDEYLKGIEECVEWGNDN
jgi:VRR-NUC domain